jgi:hypothetical protein
MAMQCPGRAGHDKGVVDPLTGVEIIRLFARMSRFCRAHASKSFSASANSLPSSSRGNLRFGERVDCTIANKRFFEIRDLLRNYFPIKFV